ncbi:MAG: hypothetical protein FJ240_02040 [Nitrospira sp.]|nr:hypothetical protein [Nitrospira sp.]
MKKYFAVLLAVIFILSFAVAAFAQDKPEITIGGELRARGWYADNVDAAYLPVKTDSQAWYDYRVRLNVAAKVTDNTSAFVQLETATESAGVTSRVSDWYQWEAWNQKPSSNLTLRQAYISHKGSGLLGVPVGIKVGHMLFAIGEKQFLDHTKYGDDAILVWTEPTKELHIGLAIAKAIEVSPANHSDDIDAYVLLGTYKLDKDNTIGLNYTWIKSDNSAPVAITNLSGLSFQNLGLHANGNISGLAYALEGDMQFGKIDRTDQDTKFGGYGVMAKLGYKLDPVNLRGSFAMGSGDNNATDDKNKEFQTTLGRDVHYTFNYEYTVRTAVPALAANGSQGQVISGNLATKANRNTGIANTTYYNLGVDFNPVKDLTLMLDGFIIRATKALTTNQSKSVGSEVDLGIAYKIDKNLTYSVTAGAFWPGKFYTTGTAPLVPANAKKTVTQAVHCLTLSF